MSEEDFLELLKNNKVYILGDVTGYLGDKKTKDLLSKHINACENIEVLKTKDEEKGVIGYIFKVKKEFADTLLLDVPKAGVGKILSNEISRDICQEMIDIALNLIEERREIPEFNKLTLKQREKLAHITTVSTVNYMPNKDVFDITFYF